MERVTRIQTFARIGYLARGVVYVLLGYFALATSNSAGTKGVLQQIEDMPVGIVLLSLVGIGLAGYGIFRAYGAAIDLQGDGTDSKGIGKRIGHGLSGLAHIFLAYFAFKTAIGSGGSSGGGASTEQESASWILSLPAGEILLALIGVGFLLAGLNQAVKAYTGKFMHLLDADAPRYTKYLGHAGFAARAVVFFVIGWQVISSALSDNAEQVGGIGQVLDTLAQTQWLYMLVAAGLLLFGLFSLVMARYRTIRDEDVVERLKAEVRS